VTTDPDNTEPYEPGSVHDALFLPWFLHRWVPEELDVTSSPNSGQFGVGLSWL
jgi:hypothetical protein